MVKNSATKEWALVGLRFVALPAVLLAPFWLISLTGAKCSNAALAFYEGGKRVVSSASLTIEGNAWYLQAVLIAVVIVFFIASFVQIGNKKYRVRYQKARTHFIAAAISSVASVIAYALLHNVSQRKYPPTWSCNSHDNILSGSLSQNAHVGLGLDPITATLVVVVYILAPLTMLLVTRPKSRKLWEVG